MAILSKTDTDVKRDAFWAARRGYIEVVAAYLKRVGTELTLDNGYLEEGEPLELTLVDDNGTGVDHYCIDKVRYMDGGVQAHCIEFNYNSCDQWMDAYLFGWDETYIYDNILWPDGPRQESL